MVNTNAALNASENSGDTFVRAFNEVRGELVSTLFFVLGNHEDAQDSSQDTFLKCWRARESMGTVRNMRAWIFRVGLNAAKDMRRNAWRKRARPMTAEVAHETVSDDTAALALEEKEDMEQLRQALMHLRPEEKAVFLLRQNGNLTYEEIAELRQSPVGTVKTLMRAALQKLREALNGK
jgi:RNA polymerase sigma-70 factor (ECF subfamily)